MERPRKDTSREDRSREDRPHNSKTIRPNKQSHHIPTTLITNDNSNPTSDSTSNHTVTDTNSSPNFNHTDTQPPLHDSLKHTITQLPPQNYNYADTSPCNEPHHKQILVTFDDRTTAIYLPRTATAADLIDQLQTRLYDNILTNYRVRVGNRTISTTDPAPLSDYGLNSSYATAHIVHTSQRLLGGSRKSDLERQKH